MNGFWGVDVSLSYAANFNPPIVLQFRLGGFARAVDALDDDENPFRIQATPT